ncbi:MAG TPA: hypothetical protein VHC41_06505 [Mycobacteriales bacterium]|nr:hypothetical protein [Mycobacteriales bacterium]
MLHPRCFLVEDPGLASAAFQVEFGAGNVHLETIAPGQLRPVERPVRPVQRRLGTLPAQPQGHAAGEGHRTAGDGPRRPDPLEDVVPTRPAVHQDHELLAAESCDQVVLAHLVPRDQGELSKDEIAGTVAVTVVEVLEVVEVEEQDESTDRQLGQLDRERPAVAEVCQRVGHRERA